jgi:hypothetical protein
MAAAVATAANLFRELPDIMQTAVPLPPNVRLVDYAPTITDSAATAIVSLLMDDAGYILVSPCSPVYSSCWLYAFPMLPGFLPLWFDLTPSQSGETYATTLGLPSVYRESTIPVELRYEIPRLDRAAQTLMAAHLQENPILVPYARHSNCFSFRLNRKENREGAEGGTVLARSSDFRISTLLSSQTSHREGEGRADLASSQALPTILSSSRAPPPSHRTLASQNGQGSNWNGRKNNWASSESRNGNEKTNEERDEYGTTNDMRSTESRSERRKGKTNGNDGRSLKGSWKQNGNNVRNRKESNSDSECSRSSQYQSDCVSDTESNLADEKDRLLQELQQMVEAQQRLLLQYHTTCSASAIRPTAKQRSARFA